MPHPRVLLVPLDGSAKDARAIAVAEALALRTGMGVHLVRVVPPADAPGRHERGHPAPAATTMVQARQSLGGVALRLALGCITPVTWEVLQGHDVASVLSTRASADDVFLVIVATRAPGLTDRTLRGSVADRLVHECPRPLLLLPPGVGHLGGKHVELSRVLVPLDGSPLAERAFDVVLALPQLRELELVLLQVVARDEERAVAADRLRALASTARARGARDAEFDIGQGPVAAVILDAVREALVDLIAMSTRGQGGLRRAVVGSVAEAVLRQAEVPVLLVTPASGPT